MDLDLNPTADLYYQAREQQDISYTAFKSPIEIHEPGHDRYSFPRKENIKHIIGTGVALSKNVSYPGIKTGYFLNYTYEYRIDPMFAPGVNFGLRQYTDKPSYQSYDDLLLPISIQVRTNPFRKKHWPFIYLLLEVRLRQKTRLIG